MPSVCVCVCTCSRYTCGDNGTFDRYPLSESVSVRIRTKIREELGIRVNLKYDTFLLGFNSQATLSWWDMSSLSESVF